MTWLVLSTRRCTAQTVTKPHPSARKRYGGLKIRLGGSIGHRVSHGTSFLAPGSLARRRLARLIHHHHQGGSIWRVHVVKANLRAPLWNFFSVIKNSHLVRACARGAAPPASRAGRALQPTKCNQNMHQRPPQAHRSSPTCHGSHQNRRGPPWGAGFCPSSELPPPLLRRAHTETGNSRSDQRAAKTQDKKTHLPFLCCVVVGPALSRGFAARGRRDKTEQRTHQLAAASERKSHREGGRGAG